MTKNHFHKHIVLCKGILLFFVLLGALGSEVIKTLTCHHCRERPWVQMMCSVTFSVTPVHRVRGRRFSLSALVSFPLLPIQCKITLRGKHLSTKETSLFTACIYALLIFSIIYYYPWSFSCLIIMILAGSVQIPPSMTFILWLWISGMFQRNHCYWTFLTTL